MPAAAPSRMRSRPGVSLVEVLVAAVVLAVGVAGTMRALGAAAWLRERAFAHERVAEVVRARVLWFAREACRGDRIVRAETDGVEEAWRVVRVGGEARLEGRAWAAGARGAVRLGLVHTRRCR